MAPITKTSGWPASCSVGPTGTRPPDLNAHALQARHRPLLQVGVEGAQDVVDRLHHVDLDLLQLQLGEILAQDQAGPTTRRSAGA
jgi:hypothetical protein